MFQDGFKNRYKSNIPFAVYRQTECNNELNLFAHNHKELEIISMDSGEADFYIDSKCYKIKKGDILIIPPYCIHRAVIAPHTTYDCICLGVSILWDEKLKIKLEQGGLTVCDKYSSQNPYASDMQKYVRTAIKSLNEGLPGWEMTVIGCMSLIFGILKKTSFFVKTNTFIAEHKFEKNVFEFVTEHYFEPITSQTMSKEMHINNSYFCRLFKKNFGCCFSKYLAEYRIEKAKGYLINSDKPISQIALLTGFNGFSYFGKVFTETVGMTPSEYRKDFINKSRAN